MLDFNDVALFVHIVRAGSFSAAGRKLSIPANTLSRRIMMLEESLGTCLLFRSTRKLSLTASGHHFYSQCVESIEEIESAQLSLQNAIGEVTGSIRVTAPVDFFDHFHFAWINEFMTQNPKVKITFILDDRQIDLIEESIDIAFRAGKMQETSLVARKLGESDRGLFASPQFLAHYGKPTHIQDLSNYLCVTSPTTASKLIWKLQHKEEIANIEITGRFQANTMQAQLQATRAGLGIGLLPINTVSLDLEQESLVRLFPDYKVNNDGLYVVSSTRRLRTLAVSRLIDFIENKLNVSEMLNK
jgi:DNA-binding transcriptional LysR family regulator